MTIHKQEITDLLQAGPDKAKAIIQVPLFSFAIAQLIPSSANDWQPRWILQSCRFPPVVYDKDNQPEKDISRVEFKMSIF